MRFLTHECARIVAGFTRICEEPKECPVPAIKTPSSAAKPFPKKTQASEAGKPPAQMINERIAGLPGWRGQMLSRLRAIITVAAPDIVEEWKWNIPVWSCSGTLCTGETYKKAVKLTFAKRGFTS